MSSSEVRQLYKDRIEVAIDIWDRILRGEVTSRPQLEELLYVEYKKRRIEPFRGLSKVRIYDKEIATVYVVGKYGLGLGNDVMNAVRHLFNVEYVCDNVFQLIRGNGFGVNDNVMTHIKELLDSTSLGATLEERLFRFMRYVFTGTILNFFTEDEFIRSYRVLAQAYDSLSFKLIRYVRFYVAFKIAEMIALGHVRSYIDRKIQKYAYCVKIDVPRCSPSDALVREVALRVYKVPRRTVDRLFPNESSRSLVPHVIARGA